MASDGRRNVDVMATVVGSIRLASGVSFLVAPEAANRLWGDTEDSGPTASLLLRSAPMPPTSSVGSPTTRR
jgi:hypothetical protein